MSATTLPYITAPYPAADMIALDNMIISSINQNLTAFTQANPLVGLSNLGNTQGTTSTFGANQVIFVGGNNVTLSQSVNSNAASATITINVNNVSNQTLGLYALGNTTQNSSTTLSASALSFNAIGQITVGYSNGSIQFSSPTDQVSHFIWPEAQLTSISAAVQGSQSIQYFPLKENVSMSQLGIFGSISNGTSANLSSVLAAISLYMGIYTNNAGTLSLVVSGSQSQSQSYTSNGTTSVNGNYQLTVPINTVLTPNDYYVLANLQTAQSYSSGAGTTATTAQTITIYGGGQIGSANNFIPWGSGTASTLGLYTGMGMHTSTSNAVPNSIPLSSINNTGTNIQIANIGIQARAI